MIGAGFDPAIRMPVNPEYDMERFQPFGRDAVDEETVKWIPFSLSEIDLDIAENLVRLDHKLDLLGNIVQEFLIICVSVERDGHFAI